MTEQAKTNYCLMGGGVISALIAILHVILAREPSLYRYIRAGQESVLGQMAEQGSPATVMATFVLAAVFAVWASYAFSGAGLLYLIGILRRGSYEH